MCAPVCREHVFKDSSLFYRFVDDEAAVTDPECEVDLRQCRDEVVDAMSLLCQNAPDAMIRMILRKPYDMCTQFASMQLLKPRFDFDSTAVRLLIKGH